MKRENGFTLIELVLVVAIMGILASIAIMSMLRSRSAANESSAIGTMRAITSAEIAYTATCGNGGFAGSLVVLGAAPPGGGDGYIARDLGVAGPVAKSGYRITVAPSLAAVASTPDCNGTPTQTGYYASGEPLTYGTSGSRSFATASPNTTIWEVVSAVAPAEPFGAPANPIR